MLNIEVDPRNWDDLARRLSLAVIAAPLICIAINIFWCIVSNEFAHSLNCLRGELSNLRTVLSHVQGHQVTTGYWGAGSHCNPQRLAR